MASQKSIKLYIYKSETSSLPFCYPNGEQVEISAFKYNAKRMGGTPTITCTLKSQYCLDSDWKNSIYCVFRDEKFYLRQTPSGTKSNTEYGYSYSLEFVSERDLLNNVYMFDAVNTEEEFDKPASNSTKISFFGDIKRFADKINASLRYSGLQKKDSEGNILGYKVIVDKGITSEEKYVLIEDTFFSNAIQEIYNTFEIPYYFKGKEIHIGYKDALIPTVFKYGVDESLLSIRRENANNKIVNKATGFGSTDNIPYYYPNKSPKGDISADASEGLNVKIVNYDRFANQVDIDEVLTYTVGSVSVLLTQVSDDGNYYDTVSASPVDCVSGQTTKKWFRSHIRIKKTARYRVKGDLWFNGSEHEDFVKYIDFISLQDEKFVEIPRVFNKEDGYFDLGVREAGDYWIIFGFQLTYRGMQRYMVSFSPVVEFDSSWKNAKGESITLSDAGLEIVGDTVPKDGDTIKQILIKKLNNATNLMPSIYRITDGRERFYNAINGKYVDESGNPIVFNNPYIEGRPSEDIINVEDIKPTIKECVNTGNQRIDMFSEIAYDDGDNDEVYTDSEGNTSYKHPHFFVKLRKLPFNLFDCAIEGSEMTFSITKGDCGACSFKVKVDDEFPYKNTVQVYEEDTTDDKGVFHKRGTLVKDENGMVLCGLDGFQPKVKPQDIQQDTINNEVWIALEKEEETYGILMPKAPKYNNSGEIEEAGYRIKPCSSDTTDDGDTFVILNIHLPEEYITAAEKKLEDVIIANMKDNNDEKFNFSITFSSIFFEEHPEILSLLDENSQIKIEYAGEQITQFVSSFSYNMNSGSALPSISVELSDSLSVSQNSIKTAINQVQLNVKKALEQESIAQQEAFISKTENDVVNGNIDFRKGVKFGDGCKVEIDEYNNTKLTIDYLTVNKKAVFTALDVQDMHHVGGRVLITPASMICNKVEEFADFYRCYFQNYDDGGNQIFNNFVVDDQAICKTLNTWGTTYYWRLVIGVGNNYIDLSKTDCDTNSDAPRAGDKIVQLGNRSKNDNSRKSAIEISAYGDNTPSLVMYTDIDSYSLKSKEIHGTIYRNNNGEYEAYFYNYGSMRLGAKEEEDGGYIAYDHKTKQLNINAIVNFLPQSTGLEQMESYQKLVKIAQGNIETWFYDGVSPIQSGAPTMSNYPVNTWEAEDYENHIGDIYYSNTGKGYRFKRSGSTWEWEIISDAEMAQLMAEVQNLQYLKTALSDGTTTVAGGLILTSLIQLGYKDAQGVRHTMAGISGLGQNSTAPAAWFGGPMVDHELNHDATEFAKSLFRFNGTGYLAKGNITWDENGYGQVGGEGDNYALKWNDKEVRIGPNIKLGAGDETIAMLANLLNMFELDTTSVAGKTLIHAKYDGLYSDGDIAAGGAFAGTPSGGGKTYLNELLDVQLATSSLNVGDMLMWNGDKYVNIPQSSITPDLSAYATQQWVLDKKYLTSVPVTSVVGQTGNITTTQVATALTDAGYKLTDTTYELATTTSNGLMSSSDKVKLNNIEEGANKYIHPTTAGYKHIPSGGSSGQILRWSADGTAVWGEDKDTTYSPATQSANGLMSATDKTKLDGIAANANNYTLPTASSSTKGGIKVGTTLSISGEVLNLKSGFPKGTYTKVQIDDYGRVVSGSTLSASDIPNLSWSKITTGKPTTISGYGITDAYTKTETDNKVAALQSLLDSMFERVYDSNNKLIRIHSNVTISSSGDLVAGDNSEGGGTSGGAYTQLEWNAIKALTQSESGLLASAYAVKEAYNELNTTIETLAGKATNVTFAQTLTSGKQIGTISIDGKSTSLYAPASYAWSEITGKPTFATVATSGSYSDLANKPTIASLMGSTAIGGTSSYLYWNGSAWATKALGSNAFTSISKVSQLTNDSGYITGITKAMVEGALTGNITSHTHSYIPLSDKGLSNGKVPYYVEFPSYNTLVSLGYNEASTEIEDEYYFKGLCKWAIDNFANQGDILLIGKANPNSTGYCSIQLYSNSGKDANTGLPRYCSGTYISLSRVTTNFGCYNYIWTWGGDFYGNAHSSSKWIYARTITLTGSVTGSVSIDGSANVTLATTTNHTHSYLPLAGGTMSNTNVVTNLNADLLDGYDITSVVSARYGGDTLDLNEISIPSIYRLRTNNPNLPSGFHDSNILTVKTPNSDTAWQLLGVYSSDKLLYRRGTWSADGSGTLRTNAWRQFAFIDSNVASASKWKTARTITLTGSVTGSVSIDGSANVSLATTTNHTHTFASLTDKPTTLSGYGITDALPLNGTAANAAQLGGKAASMYFVNNTNRGAVDFDTQYIDGFEYVSGSSTNGGVPYAIIYTANYGDAGMQANFGRDSALQYRSRGGSRWFDWRTVYDDHNANNASTVWSAKRLATPYNLICPYTWARNNDITGTLVLSLPYGFNSMMQCIELTVYDYSSTDGIQGATKFFINGYNYSGNNGIWINPYVFRIGNKNVRVRLGYYNNKCCILIGETNTGWNYPRICVDKVYGSFSESPYAYKDDDWSCAILQDESQITHVKTASDTPLYAPCYTRAGLPYVTDNDVAAKYLKLTGGTLTGSVTMRGMDTNLVRDIVYDGTGGWARDLITLRVDGVDKFNIGAYGGYTVGASSNGIYYGYIGCNSYDGLNLRISATSLSWGDNSILHTGNYNSYVPKLDGTGATGTWGINISGNAATATNADKLDGYHASYANNQPWGTIPVITSKGWMDVGKHFEFHFDNTTGSDYSTVLQCTGNHRNTVDLPSASGTLALLTDNVASATKLANSRTIWGQSFNGTGNVSGALTGVTTITTSGQICINTSSSQRNDYNEGIRCNLGGLDNWASVVLGGASGSTNGSGSGVYSLLVHSSLFRIRQNNTEVLCINTSNNVGIGTTSPSYKLHIVGTAYASENIIASGDLTAGSDIRYKDKIQDLRLSVHDIALAPAFTYKWNNREDDALVHIGSSAQYWLNTDAKDAVYYDKQNDFYHLNYASLALCNTIILARSMETQEEKIARLEERIKELEDKLRRYDSCR